MRLLLLSSLLFVVLAFVAADEPKITTVPIKSIQELPVESENKHTYKPTIPTQQQSTPLTTAPKTVKATITGPAQPPSAIRLPPTIHQVIELPGGPSSAVVAEEIVSQVPPPLPAGPYVEPESKPEPTDVAPSTAPLTVEQIAAIIHAALPKPMEYQTVQEYKPETPTPIFPLTALTPEQLRQIVLAAAQATPVQPSILDSPDFHEPEYKPTPESQTLGAINWNQPLTPEQIEAAVKAIIALQPKGTEFVQPEFKPEEPTRIQGIEHLVVVLRENPALASQFQSNPQLMTQIIFQIVTQQQQQQPQQPVMVPAPSAPILPASSSNAPTHTANPILVQRRSHAKVHKHH